MVIQPDWTNFQLRIDIKASDQEIYNAWATRAGLERWFLRQAPFARPDGSIRPAGEKCREGDTYEWRWYGYPDDVVENRPVIEANGRDLFKFYFSGDCIVTVKIAREAGETLVTLSQENIPTDDASKMSYYNGCSLGWTFYLANLKSVLEGGPDLRNKNAQLSNVINA
ncbi:MAG: SRPBCC domain-containing protein [Lewinellaceae bacterium]|nr:SRPBCC domain-containing protein [Lewinellaceae bacterium]